MRRLLLNVRDPVWRAPTPAPAVTASEAGSGSSQVLSRATHGEVDVEDVPMVGSD